MQKCRENFPKFKVGYTQTCTSLESNKMSHLKGVHHNVLSPKTKMSNWIVNGLTTSLVKNDLS